MITALPTPPSRDDPANFSARADDFLGALPDFATEANQLATDVNNKAVEVNQDASDAANSAATALTAANTATTAAGDAEDYRDQALAYAQAAGASAGVPIPTANAYLQTGPTSVPFWGAAPTDATKLDKLGGVANKLGFTYLDLGTISSGATANIDVSVATVQRLQASGTLTITFSNLLSGAVSGDFELHCVNFGGKVITWPAGNWIKPDGSYATAVGNSGVTWQTSGTDRVLVMIDNGSIYYKVMR